MSVDNGVRLNKFISDSGLCSRREADKMIENGRVKLNGRRPEMGDRVTARDQVTVDGIEIEHSQTDKSDRVYLAYNKPVGITSTTEADVKGNIVEAVDYDERVFPIGRLDKASDGLILLTNDGDIVNKILRAENAHDKEYVVKVDRPIDYQFVDAMSKGVSILGTKTKPCDVTQLGKNVFKIVLAEGLNRQIRRMCDALGFEVQQLTRTRIMHIELGALKPGQWRKLSKIELAELNRALESSSGVTQRKKKRARHEDREGMRRGAAPRGSAQSRSSTTGKGSRDERRGNGKKSPRTNDARKGPVAGRPKQNPAAKRGKPVGQSPRPGAAKSRGQKGQR